MHKFLRSVGFSNIKKEELEKIFDDIIQYPTVRQSATDSEGNEFVEITKEFGDFFGITLRGIYREKETLEIEYYYPYFFGKNVSTREQVDVEKHAEKESYAGICDEVRLGVTLIFYLQNVSDYLALKNKKGYQTLLDGVMLGALSTEGKILLPINKKEKQISDRNNKNNDSSGVIFLKKKKKHRRQRKLENQMS